MNARLDVFQVVADPSRRHMLLLLSQGGMTINAIAENFEMSRPAISQHVKALHEAGFITIEDSGRTRYCRIKKDGFEHLLEWINYFDQFWQEKMQDLGALMANQHEHNTPS
ncbi:ArsR/SmtB family transcription factor [Dyadobacter pollutisoli]|uniref:Metalloregulator ArsR/SmtB family transcription factor n=1 Tax=Dyadobacter pollutisoli TaxID=2910158 RepID=A0A9E8NDY1_9BACT|nr:metalloregulator ArsR/SmtB family transcription factor [Dyadobacter pollutisoli]WAC14930.1 metalloregulator ArsR/SmtB family transcription factor [Dyadobacter pollutisoli]